MYRHLNILVAEDNGDDAFFLKRAVLKAGINAPMQFVPDGEEALKYLEGGGRYADRSTFPMPSLLLLDLKMPGVDGFQVLGRVRKDPMLRRLPVIVFSSSVAQGDVDRAHEMGANGYCVKPCGDEGYEGIVEGLEKYWLRQHHYPIIPDDRAMGVAAVEVIHSAELTVLSSPSDRRT